MKRMVLAALVGLAMVRAAVAAPVVNESARKIPVAYNVDVVVIGGSTGAVSAAVAASEAGAKVFLAAPRPYLGEDMCAPVRLWFEADEKPAGGLAGALYADPGEKISPLAKIEADPRALPISYSSSVAASPKHKDTTPPSLLSDKVFGSPNSQSVQYDENVTITAELKSAQKVQEAKIVLFHREGDFEAESVSIQVSSDKKSWKDLGTVKVGLPVGDLAQASVAVGDTVQYAKFTVKKKEGTQRLLLAEVMLIGDGPAPKTEALATPRNDGRKLIRPMHVKKTLDDALLAAKVDYLFGCYVTDLLRDEQGQICGVVMANRAGRQAVLAKTIIDATDRAYVARQAGAQFAAYPAGKQTFTRIVIGGELKAGPNVSSRKIGLAYPKAPPAPSKKDSQLPTGPAELIEYTLSIDMPDASFASFARAQQVARDLTYSESEHANTEEIFQVPPDAMKGDKSVAGEWKGAARLDLKAFRPKGVGRLYVLGACADVSREQAAKLVRPVALIEAGARVGKAAAEDARKIKAIRSAKVAGAAGEAVAKGEVKEFLGGVRPTQTALPLVDSPQRSLPVLGTFDVVVCGGGTGGAPAGISAARNGSKTVVLEYLHGLGGVGTMGLISTYYWGYRGGFNKEIPFGNTWNPLMKAEWWRAKLREAGGEAWFGVIGCGAFVEGDKVRGVVVATPNGRGVILAKIVIDSTGNSDIAAAAGAPTVHTGADEMAQQGTGLPPMKLGTGYTNTDFTIVDETDMVDIWHVMVYAKSKYSGAFDIGQLLDTRERRRIIGDFTMTLVDQMNDRTYPDTIAIAYSNFDTHGYTVDPYLLVEHPEKKGVTVNVPYRCLLPRGMDGILVTGLGISVHRDAVPLTRMQPDVQNQGYAAGMIAAEAAQKNLALRSIDVPAIQKRLAAMEIIPERALTDRDSYPMPKERLAAAVAGAKDGHGMAPIMAQPKESLPLLREAYAKAGNEKDKITYAQILAVLGDSTGLDTLIALVDAQQWDKGWDYRGMGQFGSSLSRLDTLIVTLGKLRDKRALPAIFRKIDQLDASHEFSHHRAVALACEMIGDKSAAEPLAKLLSKPGIRGFAHTSPQQAAELSGANPNDNTTRATSIRELSLARALYRVGDKDGLGKAVLTEFTKDLRGHFARHAAAVLEGSPEKK